MHRHCYKQHTARNRNNASDSLIIHKSRRQRGLHKNHHQKLRHNTQQARIEKYIVPLGRSEVSELLNYRYQIMRKQPEQQPRHKKRACHYHACGKQV